MKIATILTVLALAAAAWATLPVADETPVTSAGLVAVPDNARSVDVWADGDATLTFRSVNAQLLVASRKVLLREATARSFNLQVGKWDSVYVAFGGATEVVFTWLP